MGFALCKCLLNVPSVTQTELPIKWVFIAMHLLSTYIYQEAQPKTSQINIKLRFIFYTLLYLQILQILNTYSQCAAVTILKKV